MSATLAEVAPPQVAALPAHSIPRRGGQPLEPSVRRFMQERTGFDFANVRIHADAEASASASRLAARAYTVGSDIYFDRGQYQPASHEGRTLLAHELAHVVQQSQNRVQPRLKLGPVDGPDMELAASGSELASVGCELREVLGRRVREDHPLAGEAGEADVGERGERRVAPAHPLECP